VIIDGPDAALVLDDLAHYGVGIRHVIRHPDGKLPTSYITLSAATASRTIVHFRNLPEYPVDAFRAIRLKDYDWIHFEGRDVPALTAMLEDVRRSGGPPCSLEVEKPRPGIERLFGMVDLLLFSQHYAQAMGHASAEALLRAVAPLRQPVACTWGKLGAWGCDDNGRIFYSSGVSSLRVVDTLGAGDAFNAAMIDAWARGKNMQQCLSTATFLAGRKCAQRGFDGLGF
jgi:ketohexokinase